MRLPAGERVAAETILAAARAGITVFDTAHAYGAAPGDNERLVAGTLRAAQMRGPVRIVTKGGMTRAGGGWLPDGRAKAIAADCEASLAALDGLPIDLYLLHAPDPRTPWRTSVRALGRLVDEGVVRRVGLCNVNRRQLDEALELAPIAAVQTALSPVDDRALRGGVLDRCEDLGLTVIAHSPLGGPRRSRALAGRAELSDLAGRYDATAAEVALAWVLGVSPCVVAIPGARTPERARSAANAATIDLDPEDLTTLSRAFGATRARPAKAAGRGEVVVVMGIPGAGKSRLAAGFVDRGYARLNRDERGGSLRALAAALDDQLAGGVHHVVLDNTYLTRAARSHVIEAAQRHGVAVRCVWMETPLAQAQVNLVERLLDRFGALPAPEEIRAASRREPWLMLPASQMRALRELEPPAADEGFAAIENVPFRRTPPAGGRPAVFVGGAAALRHGIAEALAGADRSSPHLVFDWIPHGDADALNAAAARVVDAVTGPIETAICPHPAGPPACWCRPPLPGLLLAFARAHGVDLRRSVLLGSSPAHRTLATALGTRYVGVG
jgi:aryl-alcohol dehydrogenase-like predicted oxidoreductase/predicted kinase